MGRESGTSGIATLGGAVLGASGWNALLTALPTRQVLLS